MTPRAVLLVSSSAAISLLLARGAAADELKPGSGDAGQITSIDSGVSELSLESIFVLGFDKRGNAEDLRLSLITGPTFRYFVARNAVLGINPSFLYKVADGRVSSSDLGGALHVTLGYMLPLSRGMFIKPLIGVGGFYANRTMPVTIAGVDTKAATSAIGAIVRSGIDLVFYSSARFNLFAGPEVLLSFGGSTATQVNGTKVDGQFFLSVDGGFNVGLSYVF